MAALRVGATVRVPDDDRPMRVMAVEPYAAPKRPEEFRDSVATAFVRPLRGGLERTYPAEALEPACDHGELHESDDGKRCVRCGSLIYPAPSS